MNKQDLYIHFKFKEVFDEETANLALDMWQKNFKAKGDDQRNIRSFVEDVLKRIGKENDFSRKLKLLGFFSPVKLQEFKDPQDNVETVVKNETKKEIKYVEVSEEEEIFLLYIRNLYNVLKKQNNMFAYKFSKLVLQKLGNYFNLHEEEFLYFETQLQSNERWNSIPGKFSFWLKADPKKSIIYAMFLLLMNLGLQ